MADLVSRYGRLGVFHEFSFFLRRGEGVMGRTERDVVAGLVANSGVWVLYH